ncbi:hypothetical protein NDU88_003780 [Pleurodeles waltl]|uniref:Uncharacterized protein n=1 Tax=Pleurodeles waltl TaxID=8319 RepID=A0AAV7L4V6_PLEWA|nr:hypothetical protein NDU88_003780 [Pleurodeles waltl]
MDDETGNNRCLQGEVGVPIEHANDAQAGRSNAIPIQEERRTEKRNKGDNARNGDTTGVMNTFSSKTFKRPYEKWLALVSSFIAVIKYDETGPRLNEAKIDQHFSFRPLIRAHREGCYSQKHMTSHSGSLRALKGTSYPHYSTDFLRHSIVA